MYGGIVHGKIKTQMNPKVKAYNRETYSQKTLWTFIANLRLSVVHEAQLKSLIEGCLAAAEKSAKHAQEGKQR